MITHTHIYICNYITYTTYAYIYNHIYTHIYIYSNMCFIDMENHQNYVDQVPNGKPMDLIGVPYPFVEKYRGYSPIIKNGLPESFTSSSMIFPLKPPSRFPNQVVLKKSFPSIIYIYNYIIIIYIPFISILSTPLHPPWLSPWSPYRHPIGSPSAHVRGSCGGSKICRPKCRPAPPACHKRCRVPKNGGVGFKNVVTPGVKEQKDAENQWKPVIFLQR